MIRIFLATSALCLAVGAGAHAQTAPASPGLSAPSIQFTGCGAPSAPGLTVDGKLKSLPISLTECGAKGDTVSFTDGTIAAGSNTLSSVSRACNSALDPGKPFMLHGSGASGAPQSGTIVSCSGASFVLSFTAVNATPWSGAWSATVATAQSGAGSYAPGDSLTTAGGSGVIVNGAFTIHPGGERRCQRRRQRWRERRLHRHRHDRDRDKISVLRYSRLRRAVGGADAGCWRLLHRQSAYIGRSRRPANRLRGPHRRDADSQDGAFAGRQYDAGPVDLDAVAQ
jgi:hypothetical protein